MRQAQGSIIEHKSLGEIMCFFHIDQILFNNITSQQIETMHRWIMIFFLIFILSACTEESRNQMFKQADNLLGKDLRVSYVADNGNIVKSWTVRDGKVTSEKDSSGNAVGYYYFWSNETGYVQIPVMRTIIEEIKQ